MIDGVAELDLERPLRLGMAEAIWGQDKNAAQIAAILQRVAQTAQTALVTRVSEEKAAAVAGLCRVSLPRLPAGRALAYHPIARCLTLGLQEGSSETPLGATAAAAVAVVCAGSSDLAVAQEAGLALRCHGIAHDLVVDVGVAGLQRLLGKLERLRRARVLIVCAGMEGALPTVVAGLLPQPVIAVPVSVGYGVSAGGMAALHGMLASCAPGLAVVNIDNGYGAAMAALRILNAQRC
ncbi:nickel pincer cofactor biosynthesis protein LarB [Synechococcus sp. ATX 2A4]|uniref:nickel pincer cofactor biosynthesis protein LarB n=1 Tax=Synechococcus sp. ATX 2A4 TaxID=2823727 RepID=UPI0037DA4404